MPGSEFQPRDEPENARKLVVLKRTPFPGRAGLSQQGLVFGFEPVPSPGSRRGQGCWSGLRGVTLRPCWAPALSHLPFPLGTRF